jgi:Protein of unknown function (DUF5672)
MRLKLPTVTLLCIDCLNANRAAKVLEICKSKCDFGAVKLLTNIPIDYEHAVKIIPLNSLIAYSIFMLTRVHEYVDTDHFLIVQRDGWILNPGSWNPDWLQLDYIGGLYMQYEKCGSGGFSLRSKKIMQEVSKITPVWDGTQKGADLIQKDLSFYEDGMLCLTGFSNLFKIGSLEQAADFSQAGNRTPKYFRKFPFGFHRTFQQINFNTGLVDSTDTTKDIHVSYDKEIDSLANG